MISILKQTGYNGINVYLTRIEMPFKDIFQYMFAWENEVYQNNVTLDHSWWKLLFYWCGLFPKLNQEDIAKIEEVLLSGAVKTIDALKHPSREMRKEKIKREKREKKLTCNWMTRIEGDKKYWVCLNHADQHGSPWVIPMEEGKAPKHANQGTV